MKEAASRMPAGSRFNVVMFNAAQTRAFPDEHVVPATPGNVAKAVEALRQTRLPLIPLLAAAMCTMALMTLALRLAFGVLEEAVEVVTNS